MSGLSELQTVFTEALDQALVTQNVKVSTGLQRYLTGMLVDFAIQPEPIVALGVPLYVQWEHAVQTTTPERLIKFRILGDSALYHSGFFRDRLEARGLSVSYAALMGTRAYTAAADLFCPSDRQEPDALFRELALQFETVSRVLVTVQELFRVRQTRTHQDWVLLYQAWLKNQSPVFAVALTRNGMTPTRSMSGLQ